jgi:hypothetical protein
LSFVLALLTNNPANSSAPLIQKNFMSISIESKKLLLQIPAGKKESVVHVFSFLNFVPEKSCLLFVALVWRKGIR